MSRKLDNGQRAVLISGIVMVVFWIMVGIGIYQHAMGYDPDASVIIEPDCTRFGDSGWSSECLPHKPTTPRPIGPDIKHCFGDDETRTLWDCIRHKEFKRMRRTDI